MILTAHKWRVAAFLGAASCFTACTTQPKLVGCANDTIAVAITNSSGQTLYVHLVASGREQRASVANGASLSLGASAGHVVLTASLDEQGQKAYFYDEFESDCGEIKTESITPQTPTDVTIDVIGKGFGEVTSDPPGIDCSSDKTKTACAFSFAPTLPVRLIAIPESTSTSTWNGCNVTAGGYECDLAAPTQSGTFTADFETIEASIGVVEDVSAGTVTSTPPGISCHASWLTPNADVTGCFSLFAPGSIVTLHATPVAGGKFNGFEGAGCGIAPDCAITISAVQQNVLAHFVGPQEPIDVTFSGTGTGQVGLVVENTHPLFSVECNDSCTELFDYDVTVMPSTAANEGSHFVGWTGACTGAATCELEMNQSFELGAQFDSP